MKKFWKKIEYWFDYHLVYFLYNPRKINRYYEFMNKKWGKINKI